MTIGQIFTKIGNFIEKRQIFMLWNYNCAKLANFKDFQTCLGGPFFRGHSVYRPLTYTFSLVVMPADPHTNNLDLIPAQNLSDMQLYECHPA